MINRPSKRTKKPTGFTLAELLIALAILGVIATFTIPKILQNQQDTKYNSIAKEAAGMVSGSYDAYRNQYAVTAATKPADLTPYMNYIKFDTVSVIDDYPTQTTFQCSTTTPCIQLHNGGMMTFWNTGFGGTAPTDFIEIGVDPDGQVTNGGSPSGPGKMLWFQLYYSGRLTTYGVRLANPALDPSWFNWDN